MKWVKQAGSIWDMGPRFPVLDAKRQASIPGLYLAGDVTGTPDIKAAINAGAEVARHLLSQPLECKPPCDAHVIIIGGGPAGVAAALEFEKAAREGRGWLGHKRQTGMSAPPTGMSAPPAGMSAPPESSSGASREERGISASLREAPNSFSEADVAAKAATHKASGQGGYLLLERRELFSTVKAFAKHKPLFYASTGEPDVRGALWWEEIEAGAGPAGGGAGIRAGEVVEAWEQQLRSTPLHVRLGETVTDIQKTDKFRVVTDSRSYVCDRVILCIGKLVHLLRLEVGQEAEPKVFYQPPAPGAFRGKDVLVVGSSNEALEAALALAAESRVTLAHSAADLKDAEPELISSVEEKVRAGELNRLARASVKEVERDAVVLQTPDAPQLRLKNDAVFPFLGVERTELPLGFFRKIHIAYERDWNLKRYLLFLFVILAVGTFYTLRKFAPGVVMVHTPAFLWFDAKTWDLSSLYPLLYTLVVTVFGIRSIRRWKKHRWRVQPGYGGTQTLRLASLIFFQVVFFFLVPLYIAKDWRAWGLLYAWPLVFHPGTLPHFQASRFWWWWSLALILIAIPVATYFHGMRYCTWVCGCGGLAETLGDQWRHYSPKGVGNTRKERQIYFVTGLAAVATVLVAAGYDFSVAGVSVSKLYSYTVDLFLIAIIPVAMYAFLGGKIWCRYWCPTAGFMHLVGHKKSRFRISADKHRCIACNLCTRYCEVGVDVMKQALKGEAFGMWNSSCIGCGICVHVCPTDVLRVGHHQLVTLPTAPPLPRRPSAS